MNRTSNSLIVKLSNGVYFFWENRAGVSSDHLLFALYGVKSKGKTLVISEHILRSMYVEEIASYVQSKGFNELDRVIVCYNKGNRAVVSRNLRINVGLAFRNITKRVVVCDSDKWLKENNITAYQQKWFANILNQMVQDNRFILGQISDRLELTQLKAREREAEALLSKAEEELANMPKVADIGAKASIEKIKAMKWIDKIEAGPDGALRILTKPMSCTFVPNIGRYVYIDDIKREDILYRMMKYQCLGKYFIIQPDYYLINSNFYIKADAHDRYPVNHVRNVMMRNTYFKGQACHIGNQQACHGELATAISQANKNGLEMLLMSFEVYLRSINLPDSAGQRYYVLPMGDAHGNVEVWPYVEDIMKKQNVSFKDRERSLEVYEDILTNTVLSQLNENFGQPFNGCCHSWSEAQQEKNMKLCLELIKEREPNVYEEIMKRVEKGAVI